MYDQNFESAVKAIVAANFPAVASRGVMNLTGADELSHAVTSTHVEGPGVNAKEFDIFGTTRMGTTNRIVIP